MKSLEKLGNSLLHELERIEFLTQEGLRIIQNPKAPCFSVDALLLANFAHNLLVNPQLIGDWGSGTGIIALLTACNFPQSQVRALEIMPEMADMAERSVKLNALEDQIQIIRGDIRNSEAVIQGVFDGIISNPPYYKINEGRVSPNSLMAAAKSEVHCDLKDVVQSAAKHLRDNGSLFLSHRPARLEEIRQLFLKYGFTLKTWQYVYSSRGQAARHILVQGCKGYCNSNELPPLYIFAKPGEYTPEAWAILAKPLLGEKVCD